MITTTDSPSLQLVFALRQTFDTMLDYVVDNLSDRGYRGVTTADLRFLGELEKRPSHAAEIARRLGVSRQAVRKSVKCLSNLGLIRQVSDPDAPNQKIIHFTDLGKWLMDDAREVLETLDQRLTRRLGIGRIESLAQMLAEPDQTTRLA